MALVGFSVVPDSPTIQQYSKACQIQKLCAELYKTTAFKHYKADSIHKVGYRNGVVNLLIAPTTSLQRQGKVLLLFLFSIVKKGCTFATDLDIILICITYISV